jgi:hypothetical protein
MPWRWRWLDLHEEARRSATARSTPRFRGAAHDAPTPRTPRLDPRRRILAAHPAEETDMARDDSREANPGKGRNAGQGLAGINDNQRQDLKARRQHEPLKNQGDKIVEQDEGRDTLERD